MFNNKLIIIIKDKQINKVPVNHLNAYIIYYFKCIKYIVFFIYINIMIIEITKI